MRARHDAVWTADGYVSDRWQPVSPVTGRIDAFRWQTPVAALPSDKGAAIDISPFEEAMLAAPVPPRQPVAANAGLVEPPREAAVELAPEPAAQDNSPPPVKQAEPAAPFRTLSRSLFHSAPTPAPTLAPVAPPAAPVAETVVSLAPVVPLAPVSPAATAAAPAVTPPPSGAAPAPPPLFRARADLAKAGHAPIPAVIPIVRAPDDPGIDDEPPVIDDEFADQIGSPKVQAGGWRGFWSRLGD